MIYFLPPSKETVDAKFLILVLSTSIPDSSEPFIIIEVAPISSNIAFATVVLPTPEEPDKMRFGICLSFTNSENVSFKFLGKTHLSILFGRYFSTHKKVFIIYHQN